LWVIAAQIAHAVRGEPDRGQVSQRPVDQVGEHGLDDRVPAVGDVGLRGRLGAVGEQRVVAPDREQFLGAGAVTDPAHDQPAVTGRLVEANAVNATSATSASEISCPVSGSTTAPGSAPGVQAASAIAPIARFTVRCWGCQMVCVTKISV
jgi:hypothetical protein